MKKDRFLNILDRLRELFEDDSKSLKALDLLFERGEKLDWQSFEDFESSDQGLPIPCEIDGKQGAIALFSDGACRGNPGPGAWASVGQKHDGEVLFTASGVEVSTTNNRMEVIGAYVALESLEEHFSKSELKNCEIYLFSDSKYVVDGINKWIAGWKARGWKKADKKPPENVDLWQNMDSILSKFSNLKVMWVKGHAGHPGNEYCDQLANRALNDSGF